MKTVLFALALALAMPIGAQEPMTYARLCGATEGMGDNNDFCVLWAQNNWQGMRNALSISIRTARAAENRNRYYFDHKRGAERGSFIQLKRPWMGDDWQVRQTYDVNVRERCPSCGDTSITDTRETTFTIYNSRLCDGWCLQVVLVDDPLASADEGYEAGFQRVEWLSEDGEFGGSQGYGPSRRLDEGSNPGLRDGRLRPETAIDSDWARRIVECGIDDYGVHMGVVDVRGC